MILIELQSYAHSNNCVLKVHTLLKREGHLSTNQGKILYTFTEDLIAPSSSRRGNLGNIELHPTG